VIDLRSDTVTRPTEGMRRAMAEAPLGDDVFGEDPTVNRLEEYVAELLGKEAAIYAPSGTMTNQIGVHVNTSRGDEVFLHEGAHIFNYEAGAPALLSGVQIRPLPGEGGVISPDTIRASVRPENVHFARPTLLCLENTHNTAGGKVFPLDEFAAVAAEAKSLGLKVHLDGARLFNAQAATGIPAREWCAHADTVSVCSSKGLGAPVGSLLAGDAETIRRITQINVEAPMQLARAVLPGMLARRSGRIVNIGSMFGSIGFPCFAAYSASKFALRGFSQALRRELAGSGVGVTYVSPRAVRTPLNPEVVHLMAERGMMHMDDAGWVAGEIVRAIEKDRPEAYLGFPEKLFARINGILPGLIDQGIAKQVPEILAFAERNR